MSTSSSAPYKEGLKRNLANDLDRALRHHKAHRPQLAPQTA
jgi:hypothetical protein